MHPRDPQPFSSAEASFFPQPLHAEWDTAHLPILPFFVRTVRQSDLFSLAEILASSFHSPDGTFGWLYPVLRVGIYEDLRSRLHTPKRHYACLVAVLPDSRNMEPPVDDRLIGTVEISLRRHSLNPFCGSRYLYLSNLAVQDGYRRQGVAKHLLKTCERVALEWGFSDLYLHVLENNHRARRLYWKAGYRLKSIDTNPVGWILGKPRQLLLRKHLTQDGGQTRIKDEG